MISHDITLARNAAEVDPAQDAAIADVAERLGSMNKAAVELNVSRSAVQQACRRHRERTGQPPYDAGGIGAGAERDGGAPYIIKGVSTYFDAQGNQRGQWIKTRLDDEQRQEALRAAAAELAASIPPLPPSQPPALTIRQLLNLYIFTDYHLGMLAWHKEGGQDWDLEIAEALLLRAFRHMIDQAPAAHTAIIGQLGDFLHYDGFKALTPASGHVLDADSRFPKVVMVAVRVLRAIVAMALERHEKIIVLLAEGNHDEASSVWLRAMFKALFDNDPRVIVEDSPLPFYAYQHGKVMLAFHHGHKVKMDSLPGLFAAQFRQMWGETTMAYGHSGHWHHEIVKEFGGIKWTQHPTLAARDAYASRGGYHAERATNVITYHERFGQVGTLTVKPEMFDTEAAA